VVVNYILLSFHFLNCYAYNYGCVVTYLELGVMTLCLFAFVSMRICACRVHLLNLLIYLLTYLVCSECSDADGYCMHSDKVKINEKTKRNKAD